MNKIVFIGNCQAQTLAFIYSRFIGDQLGDETRFVDAYRKLPDEEVNAIEDADLLITQVADFSPIADTTVISSKAEQFFVPVVNATFLWPFAGRHHPRRAISIEFTDDILNKFIEQGIPAEEAARLYISLDAHKQVDLDRLFELGIARQQARDEKTGFDIAQLILDRFRSERLFFTPYHPNTLVLRELADQCFGRMGVSAADLRRIQRCLTVSPFANEHLPIHPSVVRHFGLNYGSNDEKYIYLTDGVFTVREFATHYVRCQWSNALEEGIRLGNSGAFDAAYELLVIGLKENPASLQGLEMMSRILAERRQFDEALEYCRKALGLYRGNPHLYFRLGGLLRNLGNLVDAASAYREALRLDSHNPHIIADLAHLLMRTDEWENAEQMVRAAIDDFPHDVQLRRMFADILTHSEDFAGAESELRNAAALSPGNWHIAVQLGHLFAQQGRFEEAIDEFKKAVPYEPQNPAWRTTIGNLYLKLSDLTGAITEFEAAAALSPTDSNPYLAVSEVLSRSGETARAIEWLERALKSGCENRAEIHARLGSILQMSGRLPAAEVHFSAALEAGHPHAEHIRSLLKRLRVS